MRATVAILGLLGLTLLVTACAPAPLVATPAPSAPQALLPDAPPPTARLISPTEPHPMAQAQVGDWRRTKTLTEVLDWGATIDQDPQLSAAQKAQLKKHLPPAPVVIGEAWIRVIKKTETTVVIAGEMRQSNAPKADFLHTVDLTKPAVTELAVYAQPENTYELARGSEVLTINGTPLPTQWVEYWIQGEDKQTTSKIKIWRAPQVGLDGTVRMETIWTSRFGSMQQTSRSVNELQAFGHE